MITEPAPDPKRWVTLVVLLLAMAIIVLDNTVLTVAVPTILRDFHTTLSSLQWVLSGYSLVFATLLIIGGRLGDLYGARRMFIVGAATFGVGSFIASISHSVPQMVVGEAIIEGIGASLLMPATVGILSNTFRGPERTMAFATWGTAIGAAAAFGPVVGGYLTTYHSWRWAFRINVIVAPLAVLAALVFMRRDPAVGRARLDLPGACLVAVGTFSLVFAFSQAPTYGWWQPLGGRSITPIPILLVGGLAVLGIFLWYERRREAAKGDALFAPSQLRHLAFRYGLGASGTLSFGQFGFMFAVPIFLQRTRHLDAVGAGLWLLPFGVGILVGAQVAGRMAQLVGSVRVVRVGIAVEAAGLFVVAVILTDAVTFTQLLLSTSVFGIGVGLANSQLTNVILADVDPDKVGVAGGANSTVRQVSSALGIAIVGAVLSTSSARWALVVSGAVVAAGVAMAMLIPHGTDDEVIELYAPLEAETV